MIRGPGSTPVTSATRSSVSTVTSPVAVTSHPSRDQCTAVRIPERCTHMGEFQTEGGAPQHLPRKGPHPVVLPEPGEMLPYGERFPPG